VRDETGYEIERAEQRERRLGRDGRLSRRELLALAAASAPVLAGGRLAWPASARAAGPIVKPLPPEWFIPLGTNAEMRWEALGDVGYAIPNERFFVRNHTATPLIDAASWRLELFGSGLRGSPAADAPVRFDLDDLLALEVHEVTAAIECAGNGRSFFARQQGTPAPGSQWGLGAIGVARWKGVRLAEVLERAGLRRGAVDVLPAGLDATVVADGVDQGHVRRPLPIAAALDDALLAYEMNGEQLPPDHGFPLRLVVPGWIGIASIKWLGSIEVSDQPLFSPWNTKWYRLTGPAYPPDPPPIAEQPVKSAFELPWEARLTAGARQLLHGRSWSGRGRIRRVEVSTDGGVSWRRARLHGPSVTQSWIRWELPWTPPAGRHELLARATDSTGLEQPDTVPFNDNGYLFWAVVRHPVNAA
jgi:DMSO/TMAO reductase YedYZ molybdopterin-dependent catalytic subunit